MRRDKVFSIIIFGLVVHILLVLAAFDLYFASPLDHGMTPIKTTNQPLAKRVVLFVADGLRAEAVYGPTNENKIQFLTQMYRNNGSWGIARTRVPTESRPGHVAMLGGIYEDPSALFQGWKHNPVNFDSVINQSTNAWCWGSPDIITLFNRDSLPHINLDYYNAEMEDFGKNKTELLDTWVFDKVEKFLHQIRDCKNCENYHKQGNLFFLHLLGLDTAGHAYKPHSAEYIHNIRIVDDNVKKMYKLFEEVFDDKSTAYVFTSDHGMTNWGSHGSGSDHETETPLILWGSGIKHNKHMQRINQIDIAPLLAALAGNNIPINSLGKLPYKLLNTSLKNIANIMISNVLQLLQIFNVKRLRTETNSIVYVPYKNYNSLYLSERVKEIQKLFGADKFEDVIENCQVIMDDIIDGLDYYHYYYQKAILVSVTVGFIFWLLMLAVIIVSDIKEKSNKKSNYPLLYVLTILVVVLCYKQKFPITYYLYFLFPVLMGFRIYSEIDLLLCIMRNLINYGKKNSILSLTFYVFGIELLVFGFNYRASYTFLMILLSSWVVLSESLNRNTTRNEKIIWISSCLVLSIFPSLPVMKTSFSLPLFLFGNVAWYLLFLEISGCLIFYRNLENILLQYKIFAIQLASLILSAFYMLLIEFNVVSSDSNVKYISWFLFIIPIVIIPFTKKLVIIRIIAIFLGFAPFYLLVSPNYEFLFLCSYVGTLITWFYIECKSFKRSKYIVYYTKFASTYETDKELTSDVFRRGFLFMVFIFVGFFGTGNIASINSFDPMWVRAFLTVFSPFKMMGLILLKIMVPFLFTCCIFRAINTVGRENMLSMFCIILLFSDVMVLQSLYLITNKGSWLDIGTSLSHFLIMEGFVTIILLLYGFAQILTNTSYREKAVRSHIL